MAVAVSARLLDRGEGSGKTWARIGQRLRVASDFNTHALLHYNAPVTLSQECTLTKGMELVVVHDQVFTNGDTKFISNAVSAVPVNEREFEKKSLGIGWYTRNLTAYAGYSFSLDEKDLKAYFETNVSGGFLFPAPATPS